MALSISHPLHYALYSCRIRRNLLYLLEVHLQPLAKVVKVLLRVILHRLKLSSQTENLLGVYRT